MHFLVRLSELIGRPYEKAWKDLKYVNKINDINANSLGAYSAVWRVKLEKPGLWK